MNYIIWISLPMPQLDCLTNINNFIFYIKFMCFCFFLGHRPHSDPVLEKLHGGVESLGSGSCCSTPPGSSCYSSQHSSPAPPLSTKQPDSPLRPSITRSLSHLLLEEEEEPETNVDTGVPVSLRCKAGVKTITRSSSTDILMTSHLERPAAVGESAVENMAKELSECLQQTHKHPQYPSRMWSSGCYTDAVRENCGGRVTAAGQSPCRGLLLEGRTSTDLLVSFSNNQEPEDEFFI